VLTADIVQTITDDGVYAGLLSFVAVTVLTMLIMRSVRHASWVLASLCLGVLWMFGALGAFGIKFNFVNFVGVPITLGVGADYAANVWARVRAEPGSPIKEVIADTGSAVALCSLTTIIGYGSLLLASNRALQSFGKLAMIGEITCLLAALMALPALIQLLRRRGRA